MKDRVLTITTPVNNFFGSSNFYFVLLLGIFVAFLYMIISGLTGILTGLVPTLAIFGSFFFVILFIMPGYLISRQLIVLNIVSKKYLLLLSVVLSSLVAFFVFWIYFFNHIVGRVVSFAVIIPCFAFILLRFKSLKDELLDEDFVTPLTLMFFVGCMYLGILYLYEMADFIVTSNFRFVHTLPGDNVLPFIFLERVYHGEPLIPFAEGWLSSDRPPLFSAMLILLRPFADLIDRSMFYQFVGTFMQCLWIPVLYSFCKFFSFDRKISNFIIACSVFSGVFIINSTYLWPKLSTTLFFALLFFMVFELSESTKITKKSILISIIIGYSAALGVLSHSGIAFSYIALILALLISNKRMVFVKHAPFALVPFFLSYLPWIMYQRIVDPPGNHLLKWHFAGMIYPNDYTFLEAMHISYADRPLWDIFSKTIYNILHMFTDFPDGFASLGALRHAAFFELFGMAAILNVFLVILAVYFLKKFCFERNKMDFKQKIMFYFTIFSFTLWPLLMFSYGVTNINLGSYMNIILIFLLIGFGAKHSNREFRNLIFVLNILLFVSLWVLSPYATVFTLFSDMVRRMIVVTIVSAALFFAYLYKPIVRI